MKKTFSAIALLIAASAVVSSPAFAEHKAQEASRQVIALADGGTLYVFKDGKMGKANNFGRAVPIKKGETLQAADGRTIQVSSNEVARLHSLLEEDYPGN